MAIQHVAGDDRGKLFLYALSTCVWCKKTKQLLHDLNVAYDYLDVDLLDEKEQWEATEKVKKWNPSRSFPTLVIRDQEAIVGFNEERIKEALGFKNDPE